MAYEPRLKVFYKDEVVPKLMKQFEYTSIMQVPRITKICINQGIGDATQDKKVIESSVKEMTAIAGQKAVSTKAKKSISNFKLREEMVIGTRVTLRSRQMFEFLDRLIAVALPRVRDFRGINEKSFDGRGNYTMGVKEQIIFPEIDIDQVSKIAGYDITIVTSAQTDKEAYALLLEMGMPFKNRKIQ